MTVNTITVDKGRSNGMRGYPSSGTVQPAAALIGILAGMGPRSTAPFIDAVIDQCQQQYGASLDEEFPRMMILSLPTPFYAVDPQGQVAVLDAMRWTPIRPLWQDLWVHASKALPTLVLFSWLAWGIARPILADWRKGRFYLWPLLRAKEGTQ